MSRNGNAVGLDAQKDCLDMTKKIHGVLDDHRDGKVDMCKTMTNVAVINQHVKEMLNLVRFRHDNRMLVTAKARLTCCQL